VVWSAEGAGSTFTLRLPRHLTDLDSVGSADLDSVGSADLAPAETVLPTREAAR
jgi:hypothetical protein